MENNMQQIKEKYIINDKGQKTAVILAIKEYERILEDLHDISVVAERRDEPTMTFDELKERLRKDGLL